ncbi:MAG TPA: hypothetical protein VH206_17095 [Xanthobacteraceae bacterium]|jgi:hypothetical protein|nr:hypothetical protein [Xanthobacteraceae bacterium]
MIRRLILGLLLAASAAALAQPASAKKPIRRQHPVAQAQQQIACTVLGCMPIPAACSPVAGKTPGGRPTGYDVIVCPPGTWPLK